MGFGLTRIFVALTTIQLASGAGNNEACETDADCSLTNQLCVGNDYYTTSTCIKGKCACTDAYVWDTDKCKTKKYNTETCVGATDKCMNGTYCSSGTCACPTGSTHNANLKNCLTNGKKLLGEVCGSATECYGITGTVKCDTTCQCETGYIADHYACRAPHFGEPCVLVTATPPGVACISIISGDTSIEAETCQSGACACPSTADQKTDTHDGTVYTYCLTKYTSEKTDGATCSAHNTCSSKFCATCPGDTTKTCLRTSGASQLIFFGSRYCALAFLLKILLCFLSDT